jgi:signal transduction histidine kinase/CheY-like chemotaxis protein
MPRDRRWSWIPIALVLLGLGSVGMLVGVNWIRGQLVTPAIELVRAVGDAQTHLSIAHLWLEELVSGDASVDRQEIASDLERAIQISDRIFESERTTADEFFLAPSRELTMTAPATRVRGDLRSFRDLSNDRIRGYDESREVGVGSPIDNACDVLFRRLLYDLRSMDTTVRERLALAEQRSNWMLAGAVVIWIGIVSGAALAITNRERHRQQAELALRASEAQLFQAQKMEAVGRLAGGIAHDINNHLAAITAQCELVKMRVGNEPVDQRMDAVISTAAKSSTLIKRLLAFSRQQPVLPEIVQENTLVRGLEGMLVGLLGEDISLKLDLDESLWNVIIDPSQLEQVVLNLVVNAREAMPLGGSIRIATRNLEAQADSAPDNLASGQWVMLSVTDTGKGIAPEIIDRIFEPFFTTNERAHGGGLGLATLHGIVRQNRGQVAVESQVGKGTCFRIYLPRTLSEIPSSADAGSRGELPTAGAAASILLTEDNEDLRNSTQEILRALGYRVRTAASADEALARYEALATDFDLLITDVVMPGTDGKQLADRMSARNPGLRVLFVSGHTDDVILHRGITSREVDFLPKPSPASALATKVAEVLARN